MKKALLLAILLVFFLGSDAAAQCAMCKAIAETSTQAGSSSATGLNSGIVYLMAFPYLLLGAIGYAIYRHKKVKS